MSYGGHSEWISPRNWTRLFNSFTNKNLPYPKNTQLDESAAISLTKTSLKTATSSRKVLMISGLLDERLGWQLDPAFEIGLPVPRTAGIKGEYFIRLLDHSGSILVEHYFDIEQAHIDIRGQEFFTSAPAPTSFSELTPLPDGSVVLEFGQNHTVITRRTRTETVPTITILSPDQNGFQGQPQTPVIGWSASDPDSQELHYMVQYSRDGGLSWNTLGVYLTRNELLVHPSELAGSSQAQVRVLASDGFNTASGLSPLFSINDKAPFVEIMLTDDNIVIEKGQSFSVRGTAFDVEDGIIPEAQLSWYSSSDELLGTGRQINLMGLSTGVHEITLVAQDSKGLFGKDGFSVTVKQPLNRQPRAEAGPNLVIPVGVKSTIDGSGSSDPNNDPLTFAWSLYAKPPGSNPVCTSGDAPQAGFIPDLEGFYKIGLTVYDGMVGSLTDTMIVHAVDPKTDFDLDGMPDVLGIENDFDR
jgi:hypothetical protein